MSRPLYLKPEVRIVGISDGGKTRKKGIVIHVVGAVFRGRLGLEGVMGTAIPIGTKEVTPHLIRMIRESKHYKQLRVIICDGLVFGRSSKIDLSKLSTELRLPVIGLLGKSLPSRPRKKSRLDFVFHGLDRNVAEQALRLCPVNGGIPEPVRIARLIARALARLRF